MCVVQGAFLVRGSNNVRVVIEAESKHMAGWVIGAMDEVWEQCFV